MRTDLQIKICGLREAENIRSVADLRPHFLGFIFYPGSDRYVGDDFSMPAIDPGIEKVGVFVNARMPEVLKRIGDFQLDCVQLHGDERPEYCRNLRLVWPSIKIIKALPIGEVADLQPAAAYEGLVDLLLWDTKGPKRGGSGLAFDWSVLNAYTGATPFLLAGGIGPASSSDLRAFDHPRWAGIDLNSRFELEPGIKDISSLKTFLSEIK